MTRAATLATKCWTAHTSATTFQQVNLGPEGAWTLIEHSESTEAGTEVPGGEGKG